MRGRPDNAAGRPAITSTTQTATSTAESPRRTPNSTRSSSLAVNDASTAPSASPGVDDDGTSANRFAHHEANPTARTGPRRVANQIRTPILARRFARR
jgi:hypothetical protein